MPRIIRHLALFMSLFVFSVSAQSRTGIVRIASFTGSGIPTSELTTLERLVASHVAELRLFRVIDDAGLEIALGEVEMAMSLGNQSSTMTPLSADFVLGGHLGRIGDLSVLTLEITRVSSGEKKSVSETGVSTNEVVLQTRSLTRNLFGIADEAAAMPSPGTAQASIPSPADKPASAITSPGTAQPRLPETDYAQNPSLAQVAGSWRGDRGLETVRLFPNGTGLAILTGGGSMRLRVTVDGDSVIIVQDQANDAAMYRSPNFSFETARRIAIQARPMKWIFRLAANGQSLVGIKESILVSGTSTAITVDNDYVREASWFRILR